MIHFAAVLSRIFLGKSDTMGGCVLINVQDAVIVKSGDMVFCKILR